MFIMNTDSDTTTTILKTVLHLQYMDSNTAQSITLPFHLLLPNFETGSERQSDKNYNIYYTGMKEREQQ